MELRIEKGGLEARLLLASVRNESGGFVVPSLEEIEIYLKEKGIKTPIERAAVEAGLSSLAQGLDAEMIVSRGKSPIRGEDGYIEFLIDLDGGFAPATAESGAVDMRTSLILNVNPGQPLALIHKATAGLHGLDVFEQEVAAEPGKTLEPKLGANTQLSGYDADLIVAKVMGHARMSEGLVEVQEFYLVDGDVDYTSGNVTFGKSVQVRGDVKSGFSVEAGGDVEITGLIEDCSVKSRGKVFVKGGFTGQGKGHLHAQGEIKLGYVRNQEVRGESSILIRKEAINSRIQSRQSVTVLGLLAGGKIQARDSIECVVAGNETGTPTHLEAGYDYTLTEEMLLLRDEMDSMGRYSRKLESGLRQIHDIEKLNRALEPWIIELMFEMEEMRAKVDAKTGQLRERYSLLEKGASQRESAWIKIKNRVFPGVVIKIGDDSLVVDGVISGPKTFYSKDGAIQMR